MTTTLNIKKLATGMSLQDKAKLLFADRIKRGESEEREWVLTAEEREAIYNDARKNNQLRGLGELVTKYNVAIFLYEDAKKAFSVFDLMRGVTDYLELLFDKVADDVWKSVIRFDKRALFETPNQIGISPLELHMKMWGQAFLLRMIIYKIDYIVNSAGIELLSDEMSNDLRNYEKDLQKLELVKLEQKHKEQAEEEASRMLKRFSRINFNTAV